MVENADQERRRVYYRGDVQGVGFRYTTLRVAQAFQVSGFVWNLADGRVELICEGTCQELDAFLADVGGRMNGYIEQVEIAREKANGEFEGFEIRG